jgi:phosphatidylserine/phosphatidylglycerophosphate/cardiolipin synthase-like enzyme
VTDACKKLQIRWYSRDGLRPVVGNGIYASHAKYASVDDTVVIVGTANMDTQSWNNSRELNIIVDDADLATAWDAQLFVADWTRGVRTVQCPAP